MKKSLIIFFVFISIAFGVNAQQRVGNYIGAFQKDSNEISLTASNAKVRVDFCTPALFRVRVCYQKSFERNEHWMVTKYNWPPVAMTIDSSGHSFQIKTSKLKVIIHKFPVTIDVYTAEGALLCSESNTASGDNGIYKKGDTVFCRKMLQPDEHFFGFGERMDLLDRRGKKVALNVGRGEAHGNGNLMGAYNTLEANYCPVTFFMSTKGYGIFFHNTYKTIWDMGYSHPDAYSFKAVNGEMDYYFIYGPSFPSILNEYTSLTGKAPLIPKFALGLHVGTYSGGTWGHEQDASPAYVIALVKKFRELGIPIDILWLDSTWRLFASGGHGATTFEWRKSFADPKRMFDSLYALHIHEVGLHIRPRLDNGPKFHLLDSAQKAGITYLENGKPGEFPNYFDQADVNWWWNHAAVKVASQGAKFFKTDEGSAFARKANESNKFGPGDSGALSLHNIFPLAYTRAAFTKFMQYNKMRGMNQTREGYAGIQRFPYIFAGDWPSQWQFFKPIIKAGLNIGVSGVGYWTHCMGGFEQKPDSELYIRWCQFGMFSPIAMVFGMDHPGYKEPWNYGREGLRNFIKYDSLRYCLLPYLYSTAFQLYETGMPMMRALLLNYQNDYNVYNITNQYMLGDNMMICPVTIKGARSRVVYLPKGTWYNYWTGEKYEGRKYITVLCPLLQLPAFIKGGGIIPMQKEQQYIGQKSIDTLIWNIYPNGTTTYTLYDDDGESLKYQHGDYALTKIACQAVGKDIHIRIDKPEGKYDVNERHYVLKIHIDKKPVSVKEGDASILLVANKNQIGWHFNNVTKTLYVYPAGNNQNVMDISIKE